jgi:hypothetical protein
MPRRFILLIGAIATTAALTACSADSTGTSTSGTTTTGAAEAGTAEVGPTESACPMPVTFSVADKWKPAAVSDGTSTSGELMCEISARATGQTGFIRVYHMTEVPDAEAALTRFTSRPTYSDIKFTDVTTGAGAGKQAVYTIDSSGATLPGMVFAAPAAGGVVLVSLDAIDEDTQKANMSAFELARSTLRVTE